MRKISLTAFAAVCLIGILVYVAEVKASDAIDASESNFDDLVASGVALVKFYAPWCGHCKSLAPHWEEAATELKGHVNFIKVDATIEQSLAARYDIQGYPTIKVFQDGVVSDYEGGRTARDLVSFAKRRLAPTIELIRTKEQLDSLQGQDLVIILYTAEEAGLAMKEFTVTAKKLRDAHRFAAVLNVDLFKGYTEGAIVMQKPFEKETVLFPANNELSFEEWIRAESFPLIGEIGPDNYRQYIERALPIAWLFIAPSAEGEDSAALPNKLLLNAAAEQKGKLSFVYLDGERYRQLLKRYGFQEESALPKFVIESSEHFWSFPEDKELTADAIQGFCKEFAAGTLQRTVLSESIPETPVVKGLTTVVGHTMKDTVLESNKDVLIEFYAPWCGHCKTLAPIYEALAQKLEAVDTVVIAKMDATANEVAPEFQVSGFPTIYFKPAGKAPLLYDGDRALESMLSFVQTHATHAFALDDGNSDASQEL